MIILNYHKVADGEKADFYTVAGGTFRAQLEVVREAGLSTVNTDELLDAKADGEIIMLNFDDGTSDHFLTVTPVLDEMGMKGNFFISTEKIGKEGYLSVDQVKQMHRGGHTIECHGHSHKRMDRMEPDELNKQLKASVALIEEWTGRIPRVLAPPGGYFNQMVIEAAQRNRLGVIRTMIWDRNILPIGDVLNCCVVTKKTDDGQIRKWLRGHLFLMKAGYKAKQLIRAVLPFGLYLKVRHSLSR